MCALLLTLLPVLQTASPSFLSGLFSVLSDPFNVVMPLLALFHAFSAFSNSFIIEEHWVHLYAVQSFAIYLANQVRYH